MNKEIAVYLEKYPTNIQDLFGELRGLIFECSTESVEEKMWAKLPSYYVGDRFVRLIPFKDHINIEAVGLGEHQSALGKYKFTPKGMMQISPEQDIPREVLKAAFARSLT